MLRTRSYSIWRLAALSIAALPTIVAFVACSSNDPPGEPEGLGGNAGDSAVSGTGGKDASGSGGRTPGEACEFGNDASKCDGKADVACTPFLQETGDACSRDSQCREGALCFSSPSDNSSDGECFFVIGECAEIDSVGDGARFGESCDPDADECAGKCVSIRDDEAECEETCRVGAKSGCGEEQLQGSGVVCGYFAFDLSDLDVTQGRGDLGICTRLCNCDADCPGTQYCLESPTDGYAGICTGGTHIDDYLTCDVGIGGAGGAP